MKYKRINMFREIPELGYILGVYFGDGSIQDSSREGNTGHASFNLTTIDKEFAEYVKSCFELFVGAVDAGITTYQDKRPNRKPYRMFRVTATSFCRQLKEMCQNKTYIPECVYHNEDIKKAFIAGFFDSEGWVSMNRKECKNPRSKYYKGHEIRVGFGATNKHVVTAVGKFMADFGVKINSLDGCVLPSGKTMYRYFPNIESFINANFDLQIQRKKARLELYKEIHMTSSETTNQDPTGIKG